MEGGVGGCASTGANDSRLPCTLSNLERGWAFRRADPDASLTPQNIVSYIQYSSGGILRIVFLFIQRGDALYVFTLSG